MASTTPNKKAIVDFLWEWAASHSDWGKLLISKIVSTESSLSSADRQLVFDYFLQSISLYSGLPVLSTVKPTYTPAAKQIELESLSSVSGVNRLAKNQTVNFAKNISIIYGENGTGKTGYSRILKTLGFSYDINKTILPNIYATAEPQNATINFKTNGITKNFTWNGNNSDSELENISVFNSNCVQFSICDRNLIVSPIGFHLFNLVSDELNKLTQLLQAKVAAYSTLILWIANLKPGTPQYNFISILSSASAEQKLIELSAFNQIHETELTSKEAELSQLNKALLQTQIQSMRSQIQELDSITGKIQTAQASLTAANWQIIINNNKDISELENKTQSGLKEIAEQRGIQFFQTDEFNSFIQAAEKYIKVIDNTGYPGNDDKCVYCQQPLDSSAKELLSSYRTLLNDKTGEVLKKLREQKASIVRQVSQVDTNLLFNHPSFGLDSEESIIQPQEIKDYSTSLAALKNTFIDDKISADSTFSFDYRFYLNFLSDKRTEINRSLLQKTEALSNLSILEGTLKNAIEELKDRKFLSTKVADVKTAILNHKIVNKLNSNASDFNTSSISRKTTSAREELVQQDFNDLFKKELTSLRKSNLKIELTFGTDKGNSKVFQKISRHSLGDILSEGEQKAIALAEFLTELQLDDIKAPVIFDDPVNSLDHRITDEVVKRLIELSKQRQVIIFTHSILLLHSFIQQSELEHHRQTGVQFTFHRVKENFGVTGVLDEVEEINSYTYYTKKLNVVLQTNTEGQDEAKLAAQGYGHLRSAIEITVEDDMFKRTIKRYKKGVAFPSLLRIDGGKIDTFKGQLNDIYEKCCVSIDGHSSPEVIASTPTMAELRIDFDQFQKLRSNFTKN